MVAAAEQCQLPSSQRRWIFLICIRHAVQLTIMRLLQLETQRQLVEAEKRTAALGDAHNKAGELSLAAQKSAEEAKAKSAEQVPTLHCTHTGGKGPHWHALPALRCNCIVRLTPECAVSVVTDSTFTVHSAQALAPLTSNLGCMFATSKVICSAYDLAHCSQMGYIIVFQCCDIF